MSHFPERRTRERVRVVVTVLSLCGLMFLNHTVRAQSSNDPAAALQPAQEGAVTGTELPDAPAPAFTMIDAPHEDSSSLSSNFDFTQPGADSSGLGVTSPRVGSVPLNQCPYDTTGARECRVHWGHLALTTIAFNAFQNGGNVYTGYWYRWETTHGKWFDRWFNSVTEWEWDRWGDSNPFIDDYVGHSMMGAITNSLWIQDDPKGATVEFGNNRQYWRSRMRAMAFSTAYSFQWKMGPFGEAGVGHNGDHIVPQANGKPWTNETGWVELVTTPVGGLFWTMAEDALDKHVVKRFEERPRGPISLLAISFLTPARATANVFRFRPPWYRDGRQVKANSFFSQPPGPDDVPTNAEGNSAEASAGSAGFVRRNSEVLPEWPHYGGVHEFGAWWGASLITGHIWGYAKDVKYMPIDVTYSYLWHQGARWNFRYAPELTAVAMLDEPQPGQTNRLYQRKRTYGSGLSPVGFRASFATDKRIQPFLSTDGGIIYFDDRVLSPQGSQFMYTIDYGGGIQIFRKQRQSVSIGYRYQHLSNANISRHNPGADTNVFYLAVSRFRTKGYR
jgi:hypothetical protein